MSSQDDTQAERKPALLCYDGSKSARRALQHAGRVLEGGPAIVLTVWESIGSAILRHRLPGLTEVGREIREVSEEVVEELDASTATWADATAREGAEIAARAGFEASPQAMRALGRAVERTEATVWQAVLEAADEHDAAVVVLGSRGRSGLGSQLLGSVSYGVAHHSSRPLLIVPSPD